jgi:hypothetical protein
MFGLMRAKRCSASAEQRNDRRLHYCGACKTLGSLYGQKTRFLLNHDTVFLAELLSSLDEKQSFGRALQSYNCLARPRDAEEMPLALRFAATANIVLAEFKTSDHVADSNSLAGLAVSRIFEKSFRKAQRQLKNWQFPLAELNDLPALQAEREKGFPENLSELELLSFFAVPTARATALFFAHGAKLVGKENVQSEMRALGAAFGEAVYLLDAFDDYEKDFRRAEFNAIRAAFGLQESKLTSARRREIENLLRQKETEIVEILRALPISAEKATLFAARLKENLSRRFRKSLPLAATICATPKLRKTLSERFRGAIARSRDLSCDSVWWQLPFAFAVVLIATLLVPNQAREARSWRECSELGFNLMFLSAAFGSVAALPKMIFLENPEELLTKEGRKKKLRKAAAIGGDQRGGGWCSGDCCDCCWACDGCGCCEGDCCCSCGNCDCCDCNCSCD